MTTLTPTGSGRRSPLPVIAAVIAALVLGVGGGWWFAGRDKGTTTATPSGSTSCTPKASGSVSGGAGTGKPVVLPAPSTITLNVYNATTRKGLARTTAAELAARGFKTAAVANDPLKKSIPGAAEIRAGAAGALAAKVAAAQVVGAVIVADKRTSKVVDFVIGDGYAALATPDQVKVALSPSASPAPSGC